MGEESYGTTMIIAKLDSKELEQSINNLVDMVADKSQVMANKFETAMDKMKSSMKDFAITQKVSVDLMKDAWRDMSSSFDAMVKAQEASKKREGKGESEILTVAWLKDLIRTEEQRREGMRLGTGELSRQNLLIEKQRAWLKEQLLSEEEKLNLQRKQTEQLDKQKQKEIRKQQEPIKEDLAFAKKLNDYDLPHAKAKLLELENIQRRMNQSGLFKRSEIQAVERDIERLKVKISNLTPKSQMSLTDVLGMRANTLDDIARKMQAIQAYRGNLDFNTQRDEISRLNLEYSKLGKLQNDILGKNTKRITENNNALARSFGYIRNRLVYALTLGAATSFVKQVYEIRGQYELLERSLGVLVNSFQRGSEIFQELNAMAIKSPFTLMDLAGAAKQLTAYNFSANEVVNTTRRLADISAALGVPMERLTYNLGQIRAQTVLTARDARDFANAGLPIVKSLSSYYTELEGKVVSTGDVYNRMSKKMVSYTDVMAVLNKMTDEGGKFFDFQAKQADTLRVQLANLTLAWNNMLNEIGETNQGLLTAPLKGLRTLFRNWETLNRIIGDLIIGFGALKVTQLVIVAQMGALGRQIGWNVILGKNLTKVLVQLGNAMKTAFMNPATWIAVVAMALIDLGHSIYNNIQNVKELNKEIKKAAEEGAESIDKFLTNKGNKITFDLANKGELGTAEAEKAWESIHDELEASSSASRVFIAQLLDIEDVNERVVKGFTLAQEIRDAENALKDLGDTAIDFSQSVWGGIFGEGLVDDLKDYYKSMQLYSDFLKSGYEGEYSETLSGKLTKGLERDMKEFQGEVDVTAQSIKKFLDEQGITSPAAITEIMERVKSAIKAKNPEIQGELASLFDITLDQRMSELTNGAIDSNTSLWKTFMERLKTTSSAAFSNISDDFLSQSGKLSKEQQEAVDKNLEYFEKSMPQYYDAIKAMVDDASNLRIQIGVTFNAQTLTDFQKEVNKRIKESSLGMSALDFGSAALLPTANDDLSSWVKTRQDAIKDLESENKKYEKDDTDWSKDKIAFNDKLIQQNKNLLDLFHQQYVEEKKNGGDSKKDYLGDSLTKEIQLIGEIQKRYKEYMKMGVDSQKALKLASDEYNNSLEKQNAILKVFGFKTLSSSQLATMPLQEIRDFYQEQLRMANAAENTKGVEALEKAIASLNVEITKVDYKRITDGLNNELSKLKEDYELAVELDANPELGEMFTDILGIDSESLPRTFGEAFDKANDIAKSKLRELQVYTEDFDLMNTIIKGDKENKWMGLDMESDVVNGLLKWQKTFRDMFKKNITETEKMLDDYVEKYGDYSDKIARIEADRLDKIRKLNEAYYTDEMRQSTSYFSKLNAINQGATREKGEVGFDEFKNTRLYVEMFENLRYASTATLNTIREKLVDLKSEMGTLSPEQLKQVTQQFEKIDQELLRRNPFKDLISNARNYAKALGKDGKQAQVSFKNAQKAYDEQLKLVTAKKEELEQVKDKNPLDKESILLVEEQVVAEEEKLQKLRKELEIAAELNEQYNGMRMIFGEQAQAIGKLLQVVAANLQSLGELRDTMNSMFGVELGNEMDALIDDLGMVGEGINKVVSSAQSGDFVGAVVGAVKTVAGVGDAIASVFGDGAARTRRINKEIERSEEQVRQLNMAYTELERVVEKAMGAEELRARRSQAENKRAQLAEMERQLQLEKSKRSKDRDDDKIKEYEDSIRGLRNEIDDLVEEISTTLLGSDIKSAAEDFVETWVSAWRKGDDVMEAMNDKFDDMIDNMIMKSLASKLVAKRLQPIWDMVDEMTSEGSAGGTAVTLEELRMIQSLIGGKSIAEGINEDLTNLYNALGIMYGAGSETQKNLSALQQGISGITEDQAGALEAYWNANTQQQYVHTDLLTQIRDAVVMYNNDVNIATSSQILLQLQQSFQVQMAIQTILMNWSSTNGMSVRVEMI